MINNRNVPVNIKAGEINRTPLHFAASAGKLKVVKSLVEVHHADIDALDKEGASALHYAAAGGQEEVSKKVVKFLVEKGADPNKLVNNKFSVLALAINAGNIAVVQYLITSPATLIPTADSKEGKHLIKLAESLYEDTILKLLKEYYQPQNIAHNTCKTCCNVT